MVSKCLGFIILALISLTFASQFPLYHKSLKTDLSDEDAPWVWSSSHRNGHRLKFHDDDYDDADDHEHDEHHVHHEHCHHHHAPHFHFGPPSHRHHDYHGSVKNWRHRPQSYPTPLAPLPKMYPEQTKQMFESEPSSNSLNKQRNNSPPAPVFEEPEEDDGLSKVPQVPISLITSTTPRTTTNTEKPAYENIDLRFGS